MHAATSKKNWIITAILSLLLLALVKLVWPALIPYGAFELWEPKGSALDWFLGGWPLLAWAVFNGLHYIALNRDTLAAYRAKERFYSSAKLSLLAGVMEEIGFRWLIFMSGIAGLQVINFLLFGFIGYGLPELVHVHLLGPLVDVITFGQLHGQLFHPASWAVGASLISSNIAFRNEHAYQGWFGLINSWFIGLYLFWTMFAFGLPVAILLHFLYNFTLDVIGYAADMLLEKSSR